MSLRIARLLAAGQAAATIAIMVDGSCLSTAEMEIVALHVARVVLLLGGGAPAGSERALGLLVLCYWFAAVKSTVDGKPHHVVRRHGSLQRETRYKSNCNRQ